MIEQLHTYYTDPEGTAYTESEVTSQYEEMLDDVYEALSVGTSWFAPSRVLRECDPIAYRIGRSEYLDSLFEDGWTEHSVNGHALICIEQD